MSQCHIQYTDRRLRTVNIQSLNGLHGLRGIAQCQFTGGSNISITVMSDWPSTGWNWVLRMSASASAISESERDSPLGTWKGAKKRKLATPFLPYSVGSGRHSPKIPAIRSTVCFCTPLVYRISEGVSTELSNRILLDWPFLVKWFFRCISTYTLMTKGGHGWHGLDPRETMPLWPLGWR
jgi:hypothetical protein